MAQSNDASSNVQELIRTKVENVDTELHMLNMQIHANPELGYKEYSAVESILNLLGTQDGSINIIHPAFGLETSFQAEYGSLGRVVTFNAEYDALPNVGHACGHNLIAMSAVAAFLGLVSALKANRIQGRVRLLGTPAEEGGGGKIKLIQAGAYKDVDACLMTHPMGPSVMRPAIGVATGIAYNTCISGVRIQAHFTGKSAHAAMAPEEGINALDAATLAYTAVAMLRQHIWSEQKLHGVITEGGSRPNVIVSRTTLDFNARARTLAEVSLLQKKLVNCFEGAALATGCEVTIEVDDAYAHLKPNAALSVGYASAMKDLGFLQLCDTQEEPVLGIYSTDMGNVSHACPGFHGVYSIPSLDDASNHTPHFEAASGTHEAHRIALMTGIGMANVGWRVLSDEKFAIDVWKAFKDAT